MLSIYYYYHHIRIGQLKDWGVSLTRSRFESTINRALLVKVIYNSSLEARVNPSTHIAIIIFIIEISSQKEKKKKDKQNYKNRTTL